MSKVEKDQVLIFDTTLRDGEQSPGASMSKEEKVRIAKQLERLGVNIIEAGFAAASPGDFDAIKAVAKTSASLTPAAPSFKAPIAAPSPALKVPISNPE